VAYQTNATGRFEVVIKSFGDRGRAGATWQVSRDGGTEPRWRRDGKELYFVSPDGSFFIGAIILASGSPEVRAPVKLFKSRINGGGGMGGTVAEYAVARDGRFLINEVVDEQVDPITIVLNPRF
jgi:eukaryotic-like serine/threonine-protein kinase